MSALQAEVGEGKLPEEERSFHITEEMLRLNLISPAPIIMRITSIKMSEK